MPDFPCKCGFSVSYKSNNVQKLYKFTIFPIHFIIITREKCLSDTYSLTTTAIVVLFYRGLHITFFFSFAD